MVKVTFIKNGKQITIDDANTDDSLLDTAQQNKIEMDSACGGNGVCTTCLVKVEPDQQANLTPITEQEEMMGFTDENPEYRLGCQCKPTGDCSVEIAY